MKQVFFHNLYIFDRSTRLRTFTWKRSPIIHKPFSPAIAFPICLYRPLFQWISWTCLQNNFICEDGNTIRGVIHFKHQIFQPTKSVFDMLWKKMRLKYGILDCVSWNSVLKYSDVKWVWKDGENCFSFLYVLIFFQTSSQMVFDCTSVENLGEKASVFVTFF